MKNKPLITLLGLSILFLKVYGQESPLLEWYHMINSKKATLSNIECVEIKKEILYNGSIIPVAHGSFVYRNKEKCLDTILFLYSYGRIIFSQSLYARMESSTSDTNKITVSIAFIPNNVGSYDKTIEGPNSLSFIIQKINLADLVDSGNEMSLHSYWAITTFKDCYKVIHYDHLFVGWYYYIPPDKYKRKRMEKKLDKLWHKQYEKGYVLLNYF